jgi:hypothetical protein
VVKKLIASLLAAALVVVSALSAVALLASASIRIPGISNAALRFLAMVGVLGAGVAGLLAIVYLATHVAVLLFSKSEPPRT